jgi:hypothetical protein
MCHPAAATAYTECGSRQECPTACDRMPEREDLICEGFERQPTAEWSCRSPPTQPRCHTFLEGATHRLRPPPREILSSFGIPYHMRTHATDRKELIHDGNGFQRAGPRSSCREPPATPTPAQRNMRAETHRGGPLCLLLPLSPCSSIGPSSSKVGPSFFSAIVIEMIEPNVCASITEILWTSLRGVLRRGNHTTS